MPGGPRGESTGFEHHDLVSVDPRFVDQAQWNMGRLASARWGDEHCRAKRVQSRSDITDDLIDGKRDG
jgi:hypothetical protein